MCAPCTAEKKAQERDEDTKRFLAEEKKREEERKKEKEEEGSDSLEKLRLKIKSLQVSSIQLIISPYIVPPPHLFDFSHL